MKSSSITFSLTLLLTATALPVKKSPTPWPTMTASAPQDGTHHLSNLPRAIANVLLAPIGLLSPPSAVATVKLLAREAVPSATGSAVAAFRPYHPIVNGTVHPPDHRHLPPWEIPCGNHTARHTVPTPTPRLVAREPGLLALLGKALLQGITKTATNDGTAEVEKLVAEEEEKKKEDKKEDEKKEEAAEVEKAKVAGEAARFGESAKVVKVVKAGNGTAEVGQMSVK